MDLHQPVLRTAGSRSAGHRPDPEEPFPAPAPRYLPPEPGISGFNSSGRLGEIRCPTLVLAGKEDILLPVAFSEELVRGMPGAEIIVLEATGHGMLIETPGKVADAMQDFLNRHARSDSGTS